MISEKKLATIDHRQLYQSKMAKVYNKKVYPKEFSLGNLVLRNILAIQEDNREK